MSTWQIDWYEDERTGIKVCVIEDDAFRKILVGSEFSEINPANIKLILNRLVEDYWWLCSLRELIMDPGSEFGAHRINEDGT
jgi:hypothetical protein